MVHVNAPPEEGAWLEATDGTPYPIHGGCSLGRIAANTIVLDSPKVSRRHALIHLQNIGELWLIDFGSSNGTFLNKRRINHPIRLSDGDQITIGDQIFNFRQPLAISEGHKTELMQRTLREIENILCWLLVADIRGFTPLSRQMQSEDLDLLLGGWIFACKEMIEKGSWRIPLVYYEEGRFEPSGYVHLRCAPAYFETADVIDSIRQFAPDLSEDDLADIRAQLAQ